MQGVRRMWAVAMVVAGGVSGSVLDARPAQAEPSAAASENWATQRAKALTSSGKASLEAGDGQRALTQLREAIQFDASYGPAYLALADAYRRLGDPGQAVHTLDLGLAHVPGLVDAHLVRAELLDEAGQPRRALDALLSAHVARPQDTELLRTIADRAIALGALPLAMAMERQRSARLTQLGQREEAKNAGLRALALSRLLAEIDPVGGAEADRGWVRSSIASLPIAAP